MAMLCLLCLLRPGATPSVWQQIILRAKDYKKGAMPENWGGLVV